MTDITDIVMTGANGRMGRQIIGLINGTLFSEFNLAGAVEAPGNRAVGRTVDRATLLSDRSIVETKIVDSLDAVISLGDVLIDFTSPEATLPYLEIAARHKKAAVIGTTGHSPEQKQSIQGLAEKIPIVIASNMSVGVNVMWKILSEAAKTLGPAFDIEVVEMHHRLKKDAPSGTAMTTAEVLAQATGRNLAKDAVYHREGMIGERKPNEIGIQTLRGGDIVGDHTVYFAGTGEVLSVTHRATSRDTFAVGALRAARWVVGKKPGLYSMQDVLGLKDLG